MAVNGQMIDIAANFLGLHCYTYKWDELRWCREKGGVEKETETEGDKSREEEGKGNSERERVKVY